MNELVKRTVQRLSHSLIEWLMYWKLMTKTNDIDFSYVDYSSGAESVFLYEIEHFNLTLLVTTPSKQYQISNATCEPFKIELVEMEQKRSLGRGESRLETVMRLKVRNVYWFIIKAWNVGCNNLQDIRSTNYREKMLHEMWSAPFHNTQPRVMMIM